MKKVIKEMREALKQAPEGSLRISRNKGFVDYYYIPGDEDKKRQYMSNKEEAMIRALAQKSYDQKVLRSAEKELQALNSIFKKYYEFDEETKCYRTKGEVIENIYESMPEERQTLVEPIALTDKQFIERWLSQPYEKKAFGDEDPEFYTDQGERVRSKSEVLIANMLFRKGIPYKYECPVELKGFGKVYPDFRILDVKRRKEWYWEHLGKLDDPEYIVRNLEKIIAYEKNEIIPGINLILTYEASTRPINMKLVETLIDKYLGLGDLSG